MTETASLTGTGGFVYDASFCPPGLLPQFASLPGDAAAPPYLIDLFPSLSACQQAFPNCLTGAVTGTGDVIVVPFNMLSYDKNGDLNGLTSPYTRWTCYCAGIYRVRARVCAAAFRAELL
jgi:hypothetical protein